MVVGQSDCLTRCTQARNATHVTDSPDEASVHLAPGAVTGLAAGGRVGAAPGVVAQVDALVAVEIINQWGANSSGALTRANQRCGRRMAGRQWSYEQRASGRAARKGRQASKQASRQPRLLNSPHATASLRTAVAAMLFTCSSRVSRNVSAPAPAPPSPAVTAPAGLLQVTSRRRRTRARRSVVHMNMSTRRTT